MPRIVALDLAREDGTVVHVRVPIGETELRVPFFFAVSVVASRAVASSTAAPPKTHRHFRQHRSAGARDPVVGAVAVVFAFRFLMTSSAQLHANAFPEIPAGVLAMTQLTKLNVRRRCRVARVLTRLFCSSTTTAWSPFRERSAV